MDIIWFIGFIAIFFTISSLQSRITKLESQLKQLYRHATSTEPQASDKQAEVPAYTNSNVEATEQVIAYEEAMNIESTPGDRMLEWIKEDWLLKLGVVLLLIGFGWLTTYAFLHNWIGPAGRIMLGLGTGLIIMIFGWLRMRTYLHQGGVFLVLGSTTVLLTIFAAREIYGYFTPASALVVMFICSAFVAMASVQYNRSPLALASLVMAGVAPLLTDSPSPDYIGLFLYLFVVIIGTLWLVVLTGKRELTTASLILISFYSLPHIFSLTSTDPMTLLPFAFGFAALFFVTNTTGIVKSEGVNISPDLITAAGNGLFLLAWIVSSAPQELQSLLIAAWMIIFAVGAFAIFTLTGRKEPFYVYAGISIAMLAAATSAELSGATLVIAFAFEAGIIPIIAYVLTKEVKIASRLGWLLAAPSILSLQSVTSRAWASGIVHEDFFVLLVLALMFFELGLFLLPRNATEGDEESKKTNYILLVMGSVYAFALLWLSLHAGLADANTAVMLSLAVYTVTGLISYFYAIANSRRGLMLYGAALIGFVVCRLLVVDVWRMPLAGRIVTFLVIGTLLVSSAFFGKKNGPEAATRN